MNKITYYIGLSLAVIIFTSTVFFGSNAHAQTVGVTLPSIPTSVTATVSAPLQVTVSWGASTETSGTIEGYYVDRNGAQITTTAGTSITDVVTVSGLYSYTIASYDANGNTSAQSAVDSVSVIKDTTPPTAPTNLTFSGTTSTNSQYVQVPITISWAASTDNIGVVGYYVYRNGVSITSSTSAFTGTSITDTIAPGSYNYTVVAYDAAQNVSPQSTPLSVRINVDNIPPSVPTNISVQQISGSAVNILWATSTDNTSVAGYQIYRNGIQIATTTASPYSDSDLSIGTTYTYAVTAYDVAGNISEQSIPQAKITLQLATGPGAPYALSTSLVGTSTVKLQWAPSIDSLAISAYTIYRNGTQVAAVTSTNYFDMGLASGTYAYTLSAADVSGAVSKISATSTIIVPAFNTVMTTSTTTGITVIPIGPSAPTTITTSSPVLTGGASSVTSSAGLLTQSLYYGLRNAQVSSMQSLLVNAGYLAPQYATGFFGNLTLSALEKFQCDKAIVCSGGVGSGIVGPKTRSALNVFVSGSAPITTPVSPASSTTSLSAQIQLLESELAALQQQAQ